MPYAAQYKLNAHINGKLDILHSKCTNNNHRVCVRAGFRFIPYHTIRYHPEPSHPTHTSSQDDCFVDLAVTSNTLAFKGQNWDPLMCLPYVSFVVGQMEIVLFLPCQVTNFHCLPPLIAYLKQKKKPKK